MVALTPSERRGALTLVVLLLIGAGHDLWRARTRVTGPAPPGAAARPAPDDARSDSIADAPSQGPGGTDRAAPVPAARPPVRVDLNRAGVRELDALPGVGPVIAGRIVQQRARYGPFEGLDDLLAVRGVGPRLLERLRPWATVEPPSGVAASAGPPGSDSAAKSPR